MEPIFQAMNNTHNIVEEYLHDCNDNRKLRNNLR